MTKLEETVAMFRQTLSNCGSSFLLIYTEESSLTQTLDCRITANIKQEGVRAIMNFLMRPTHEAVALTELALESSARAACGISESVIEQAAQEGAFRTAAVSLLDQLRKHYTVAGWDQPQDNSTLS